jgi:hypothetical protein
MAASCTAPVARQIITTTRARGKPTPSAGVSGWGYLALFSSVRPLAMGRAQLIDRLQHLLTAQHVEELHCLHRACPSLDPFCPLLPLAARITIHRGALP